MIDDPLRSVAFSWLEELVDLHGEVVAWNTLLAGFEAGGRRITLVGPTGIWKPHGFVLPGRRIDRLDRERIEWRFERFRRAG